MLENGTVAAKKLFERLDIPDNKFNEEIRCLMKVKHKNIVRFLGYCANIQGEMVGHDGDFVMADLRQRLLCFEYVPKGSLDEYIKGKIMWPATFVSILMNILQTFSDTYGVVFYLTLQI